MVRVVAGVVLLLGSTAWAVEDPPVPPLPPTAPADKPAPLADVPPPAPPASATDAASALPPASAEERSHMFEESPARDSSWSFTDTDLSESPQHFAVELKFGPYGPAIDNTRGLGGRTPFSDLFGDPGDPKGASPSWKLLSQVEFDYQFFHRFGTLAIGLSGGYYSISAPQLIYFDTVAGKQTCQITAGGNGGPRQFVQPGGTLTDSSACFSGDSNIFSLMPLEVLLIYRFDVLNKRLRVPIIPYMKAGFASYFWWNGTSGAFVAKVRYEPGSNGVYTPLTNDQPQASGASTGIALHPGIAIDLGVLDRQAQRIMDREIGVNRVSLFGELNYAWVNSFNASNKLDLSNTSFNIGLSVEF